MSAAAFVHAELQQGLFVGFGKEGRPSSTTSSGTSGFAPLALGGITILGASIAHLKDALAMDVFKDFDSNGYVVKTNIGSCRLWLACAEGYYHKLQGFVMDKAVAKMHKVSAALASATPRWDVIFGPGSDSINEPLVRARILQNNGRATLRPAITFAKAIVHDIFLATDAWALKVLDALRSAATFTSTTFHASECLLLITAGLNTVLFPRDAHTSKSMATEVLHIASQKDDFLMPHALERRLQNLADGAEQQQQQHASPSGPSAKDESGPKLSIVIKREVTPEPDPPKPDAAKKARLGAFLRSKRRG